MFTQPLTISRKPCSYSRRAFQPWTSTDLETLEPWSTDCAELNGQHKQVDVDRVSEMAPDGEDGCCIRRVWIGEAGAGVRSYNSRLARGYGGNANRVIQWRDA